MLARALNGSWVSVADADVDFVAVGFFIRVVVVGVGGKKTRPVNATSEAAAPTRPIPTRPYVLPCPALAMGAEEFTAPEGDAIS